MGIIHCEADHANEHGGKLLCLTNRAESPWVKEIEVPSAELGVEM
jgi:hypothetical protein